MADSSSNATNAGSHFLPTVTLFDWWLVKSLDNRLCISGNASRKGEAVRVFNSSPIVERYDAYSLKNAEGIYIFIRGIINEERTCEKGFTPQIFNSFYIGFPPNWETCWVLHCIREEEVEPGINSVNAAMDTESPICEDILSDDDEKSASVLLALPEEAPENNQTPFPGDECEVSKEMSGVNVACGGGVIRRSTRLHSINVCQQKEIKKHQPMSRGPLKHPHEAPCSTSKEVENRDSDTVNLDNVSANLPEISSHDEEKSISVWLELLEEAPENNQTSFPGDECEVSKEMSGVNVVCGGGVIRRSTRLHSINVCQQKKIKKHQPMSRGPLKHPHEEPCSTSKEVENRDSDNVNLDNVSANLPEISSHDEEKSISVSLELPEEAPENNQTSFPGDECEVSKETSGVNVVCGGGVIRRSTRLHSISVCQQKEIKKHQPMSRGSLKHPHEAPCSTSKEVENRDSDTVNLDNVSANLPEISSHDEEKPISVSLELPEEAPENNQTSFPGDECEVSKEMSGVNVVCGGGVIRRSTRLHSINVCQQKEIKKHQLMSRGPLKHPHEEPCSTSKEVENRDSDTVHLDNVSANLPEISSCAVENSFPTSSVTPEKATGHCNKLFPEGEEDMSIKTSEANVVHGSGGNRRSARLHNVKSFPKKSDGGLENLSTPVQSQNGIVNTLSGKVTNKFRSKISSAKTEVGHKKKKVTVETEAVNPKRKVMKPSSSVKSPQGRDVSHLNKGTKQGLSIVSPDSLSLKKSRSGRLLLPSMEFWRNEIPIYNADRGVKEIQQDSPLTSPFRGFSPSPFRGFSPSPGRF